MKRIPVWLRILLVIILVAAIAFAVLPQILPPISQTGGAGTNYQTVIVQRSNLVATISVTGTIRSNQTTNLNWQVNSRVGEVRVAEGQKVNKGDILVMLDPAYLPQNLLQAQNDLINAQNNLKNLYDQAATSKANAEKVLAQAQKDLEDAQTRRDWLNSNHRADDLVIQKAEADYFLAQDRVKLAQENFDNVSSLDADATLRAQAQSALAAAQSAARQARWTLDYYRAKPSSIEIAQSEANLQVAKAKLADAQRQYNLVKDGPVQKDVTIAQNSITVAQAAINQTRLTAPFSGTVTDLNAMSGDSAVPNTIVMRIDDLSKLFIDSQVSEVDINRVKAGQPASITFDAIPNKTFVGQVVSVGSAGANVGGVVNFPVSIQLTDQDASVKPGMTAGVNITVDVLNDVLAVPIRAVRTVSGKRVVFIPDGATLKPVIVELGSTADTMVEITGGELKEGDTIVLNPPAQTVTFGPGAGGAPFGR